MKQYGKPYMNELCISNTFYVVETIKNNAPTYLKFTHRYNTQISWTTVFEDAQKFSLNFKLDQVLTELEKDIDVNIIKIWECRKVLLKIGKDDLLKLMHEPDAEYNVSKLIEKHRVWLNIQTGEFSNSWSAEDLPDTLIKDANDIAKQSGQSIWKLIEYECLNDREFTFNQLMKLR